MADSREKIKDIIGKFVPDTTLVLNKYYKL
jgi:hypothetical protein